MALIKYRFLSKQCSPSKSGALTLVELLVALAVIGIVLSLVIIVSSKSLERSHTIQASSNARQLIQGVLLYAADNQGKIPFSRNPIRDANGEIVNVNGPYWDAVIQPYLGRAEVSQLMRCPIDKNVAHGFGWSFPELPYTAARAGHDQRRLLNFWSEPSKVMLIATTGPVAGARRRWVYSPVQHPQHWGEQGTGGLSTAFAGGAVVAFLDGHVRWLDPDEVSDSSKPSVRAFWGADN